MCHCADMKPRREAERTLRLTESKKKRLKIICNGTDYHQEKRKPKAGVTYWGYQNESGAVI